MLSSAFFRFYFILFFLNISAFIFGQSKADSLLKIIEKKRYDTSMVNSLVALSTEYGSSNPDKALWFAEKGKLLSEKLNYQKGLALSLKSIGCTSYVLCKYEKAIDAFKKVLDIYFKINDKNDYAYCLRNIGIVYSCLSDYPMAISYYQGSVKIFEAINDKKGMAYCYNNIGTIYCEQNNFEKALKYCNKSVKLCNEVGDKKLSSITYGNIGNILFKLKKYSMAIESYMHSLKIASEIGDKSLVADNYNNIANIQSNLGNNNSSIDNYKKSLKIKEELGNKRGIAVTYNNLAELYNDLNKFPEAIDYAQKANILSKEIGCIDDEQYACENLSFSYEGLGNYNDALKIYKIYKQLNDSIYNKEKYKQIAKMEAIYQSEKNEKEIKLLSKEKEIQEAVKRNLLLILSVCVLMILLILLLFNSYRIKQREKLNNLRIDQQEAFFKTVIKIQEEERNRFSKDIHDGIGQYISALKMNLNSLSAFHINTKDSEKWFNKISEEIDELCKEIRNVSFNIMPGVLLNKGLIAAVEELILKINKVNNCDINLDTFDCNKRMDSLLEINLYRIIQELLNNILKYANANKINIQFTMHENELNIIIEDDGIGFDTALLEQSTGNGWNNISSRIQLYKGTIHIDTKSGKNGTTVIIDIPSIA